MDPRRGTRLPDKAKADGARAGCALVQRHKKTHEAGNWALSAGQAEA